MELFFLLALLGLALGTFGTLVGAGGGFILMPVLLIIFPKESPEILTSISLAVVFFNAASGSAAYARMKKIDYRSGLIFSAAAVPGAILGSLTVKFIDRDLFNIIFGILMIATSVYLFFRPPANSNLLEDYPDHYTTRNLIDKESNVHNYAFNIKTGIIISVAVGFISSMLGIGGGIIHVPAMVSLLNFPVHIATATSHFVLAIMAFAGTVTHLIDGSFTRDSMIKIGVISVGIIIGAQIGARLSRYIRGNWILRALAAALGFAGLRIILMSF